MTSLYGLTPDEVAAVVTGLGEPRYRADQLLNAAYKSFETDIGAIQTLPVALRTRLAESGHTLGAADEIRRAVSDDGETTKLLLRMGDGTLIETVLMQYTGADGSHPRSTVCVSTQAGCAMGCVFCATGQMGFERNLEAAEIVAQVVHFARILAARKQHVTNVVFMGMGEPLANYDETMKAVRILTHPKAFGLGQRHITISTVGVIRGIERLAQEDMQIGLAISLHSPFNDARHALVPTAGPRSVDDLISAAERYFKASGRRVTFEYALIDGQNDSFETAEALAKLMRRTGAHVNLIPVNPTAGGYGKPNRQRVLAFERVLRDAGVNTTIRVEKGSEISAACGQLRTTEVASRKRAAQPAGEATETPSPAPSQTR
ncbi:MAG TPA: 23S rRNA (adenine(2503)-C(2))-methyltransferase RlmN [Tepidiformaceae bacterium]|nr:23S rRNA (adenine(2503)-C(2))-methyltransferase RlmN [Tepidiformaceae bacterium]